MVAYRKFRVYLKYTVEKLSMSIRTAMVTDNLSLGMFFILIDSVNRAHR